MKWALIGKILTILLVIGVIGGGSYYLGTRSSSTAKPTPTPSVSVEVQDEDVEATPEPTGEDEKTGEISGVLGFPSEGIPPLSVYAIDTKDGSDFFFIQTAQNQSNFTIEDVEPGTYYVVAYTEDSKLSGGWSKMVPCGLSADCKDHSLIPVEVKEGKSITGIEVRDWYSPEGTFPAKPQ
ncbi:hypothetical protein A3G67_01385 [Candidatus Roizmanbacteria bacterium RIFCSPLOWO2_12_FULL_40_12]|nr:MAG: hypothetical protein A3G67_01385 [Candidatus Roizmanbacteria bacterium RIFCSPLOWO2_12_FULL_40_12]